jgi:hypothetical protein
MSSSPGDGSGQGGAGGNDDQSNYNPGFAQEQMLTAEEWEEKQKRTPQGQAVAAIQKGLDAASITTKEGVATGRADLQPYADAGVEALGNTQRNLAGIEELVTNPEAQKSFVEDNPFFKALADDAQRRIFNNKSSRGKVASGGTAEALQNSILLMGNDLVDQNISQRSNLAGQNLQLSGIGLNAAGGQANITGAGAVITHIW